MNLKEKYKKLVFDILISNEKLIEKSEQIADDYAIEFSVWIDNLYPKKSYLLLKPRIELLEIFKKEKGYDN